MVLILVVDGDGALSRFGHVGQNGHVHRMLAIDFVPARSSERVMSARS